MTKIEISQISSIGRSLFVICLLAGAVITAATRHPAGIITGAALGLYLMFALKVVQQWEKVAVLRLGRYVGLRGPGVFHIIPIVETLSPYVDQRVRVANVSAESTLTRARYRSTSTPLSSGWSGMLKNPFWKLRTLSKPST